MLGNRAGSQELIQLGERIRQKRKDSHLTQETFAEKAGISVNTVSRIEGGQAAMSIEIFAKLVEILDADANELLGRNPEELYVFEDALYAIQTAKLAGYHTVGVYDEESKEDQEMIREEADIYMESFLKADVFFE